MSGNAIFASQGLKIRSIVPLNDFRLSFQEVLVAAVDREGKLGASILAISAGQTFTKISGVPGSGLPDAPATHLVPDLSHDGVANNRVYAAVIGNSLQKDVAGIYKSEGPDVGLVWTKVNTGIPRPHTGSCEPH